MYEALIKAYSKITEIKGQKTLLEIAGKADSELVISNCLAFFLDANEDHGLGDEVLLAFLDAVEWSGSTGQVLRVEREVVTHKGTYIDLLIEMTELVIVIENKLYQTDYNNFGSYEEYGKERAGQKQLLCVLLSKLTVPPRSRHGSFRRVTYERFLSQLDLKIPYLLQAGTFPYLNYLIELIRILKQEPFMLNAEFVKFFKDNESALTKLLTDHNQLNQQLEERRKVVEKILKEKVVVSGNGIYRVGRSNVGAVTPNLSRVVYIRIQTLDMNGQPAKYTVDADLSIDGWRLVLHSEYEGDIKGVPLIDNFHEWLKSHQFQVEPFIFRGLNRVASTERLDVDATPETVVEKIIKLLRNDPNLKL